MIKKINNKVNEYFFMIKCNLKSEMYVKIIFISKL